MEVKEKNKKLLIIVGVLLLFGGLSLAYFVTKILSNGNGGNTSVTTAVINGATLNIEGVLSFEDLDILPGHKSVSAIKVTATGNNELVPYNLIWKGTNTLTTTLNFVVYKTSEEINVNATCEKKSKTIGASKALSEECSISNIDKLGSEIASGTIKKDDTKVTLAKDEFITASPTGQKSYYYIILEYPNLDEPQNYDLEGAIEGEVTVEESNIKPDINILAAYVIQEDGTYKEVEDIPQEGYALNSSKSVCSNGATPTGVTPNITVNNLNKSGTSCYLYFDKVVSASTVVANIIASAKTESPDFSQIATEDEGVYSISDGMYGGTSYYWRGAATTNYLRFAGFCWRIIRINGDGSIRLIYDGATCHANGTNTAESIAKTLIQYNTLYNTTAYVGWTYVEGKQRPESGDTAIDSNAKVQTEEWYNTNLISYSDKIAEGKFCNDRNTQSGNTWIINGATLYYAGNKRMYIDKQPTLSCPSGDVYTLKAGAITADEVMYAGFNGSDNYNMSCYLYNGQPYWAMTPVYWYNGAAFVLYVSEKGHFAVGRGVHGAIHLRPVINLKADITISSGNGTLNNPYIVL